MKKEDRLIGKKNNGELFSKYLRNDFVVCPYCDSSDVQEYNHDYESGNYYAQYRCEACDAEWDEIYELTGIYEVVGPDPDLLKDAKNE